MAKRRHKRQYLTAKRFTQTLNRNKRRYRAYLLIVSGRSYREAATIMQAEGLKACHMTIKRDFEQVRFEQMLRGRLAQ